MKPDDKIIEDASIYSNVIGQKQDIISLIIWKLNHIINI